MDNVTIADKKVARVRSMLAGAGSHKVVPVTLPELVELLESLERLAALERHLYNLTFNAYGPPKHAA